MTADAAVSAPETSPQRRVVPAPNLGSWIATAIITLIAYLLVGHGVMAWHAGWQVPLFVGAIAGLAAADAIQAAVLSAFVLAAGLFALPPSMAAGERLGLVGWLVGVMLATLAAIAIALWRAHRASHGRVAVDRWLSALLVVWLLCNLWTPLLADGYPPRAYGPLKASTLRAVPVLHTYVNDDALYLRVYHELHQGRGYYDAFRVAWSGLAQSPAFPSSVTSVRLPTMYWLWGALPADPFAIVYLFLGFASLGAIAAATIAGQLAGARYAALAAAGLVAYAMGSAITVYVTYIDLPATCIALMGIALFVRARVADDLRYLWAAAVVLTCAALTREILVYVAVLAFVGSLVEPKGRRAAWVCPWIASLAVFSAGYAAHALVVSRMIVAGSVPITYLKGSPHFAIDSIRRFTDVMTGNGFLVALLLLLALLAAVASRRRAGLSFTVFAVSALVAPVLTMLKIGNPGIDAMGNEVNYWGNLYIPIALALWPAFVLAQPAEELGPK